MKRFIRIMGVGLVSAFIATGFSAVNASRKSSPLGTHISLKATDNTRDLGGIQAQNGQHIRKYRLIRSDALNKLSAHDKWKLQKQLRVKVILDFRSKGEIHNAPDATVHGARNNRLSVMANPNFGVHTTAQYIHELAGKQPNNMELFYQKMVTQPHSIKAYRTMFRYLLKQRSGGILYHCTYGKDRTGIATMLILSSLGIPKTTIMKNYLASNRYLKSVTNREYRQMRRHTHNRKVLANLKRSRSAKAAYLNAAYSAIYQQSGSIKHYLRSQMHLSANDIQKLRHLYLNK